MSMEYGIVKKEILRRKTSYLTLSLSLLAGLFVFSTVCTLQISYIHYLLFCSTLFLIGAFSFTFLRNLSRIKTTLTNQLLKREAFGISKEYPLHKISHVKIKWTTHKTIREIYIWLNNGESVFISALEHPEQFKKDLLEKLDKHVIIKETHEPIDFDHPLFYSLLGFPISGVGVWAIQSISRIHYQQERALINIFFVYLLLLGIFFLIASPLSKRYIRKNKIADVIVGAFMIISGLTLLLLSSQ